MREAMNVIVIVSDTLRAADLGCYGNAQMHTPCIDAYAGRSMRFDRAFPESLPTIPVRRALHTGRRAYPFDEYEPLRWDIVSMAGWQGMDNRKDTLAENLAKNGYHTGFVTDTMPYFAPGLNFTRGFWQWEFIRGQQMDRWRSPFAVPDSRLGQYGDVATLKQDMHGILPTTLANNAHVQNEEDTSTAGVFRWAMRFLEDNVTGQPFYLLVDCFDPHEPWKAPETYYNMYGKADYSGRKPLFCGYGPLERTGHTREEADYLKAHYCGLISMLDTWFGKFVNKLDSLGLADNTAVFFVSDHGTNFCENPRNIIGKPEDAMYPAVMRLPLLVNLPGGAGWGRTCRDIVYNLDVTATIYDLVGIGSADGLDGASLKPLLHQEDGWTRREYATCRYSNSICYIDDKHWFLTDIDGQPLEAFDLATDPECRCDIAAGIDRSVFDRAWKRILDDANGELPDYRNVACPETLRAQLLREDKNDIIPYRVSRQTDAIGRTKSA